jgi:hypothetical protein
MITLMVRPQIEQYPPYEYMKRTIEEYRSIVDARGPCKPYNGPKQTRHMLLMSKNPHQDWWEREAEIEAYAKACKDFDNRNKEASQ